jgi:hypothetical protein
MAQKIKGVNANYQLLNRYIYIPDMLGGIFGYNE